MSQEGALPEISVIIGTYNRPLYVQKAIESLLMQTIPMDRFEVLLMDNSTNEETKQLYERLFAPHRSIRYIRLEKVSGNNARTVGVEHAKGTYVAFLDDDAIADPLWIESILSSFTNIHPEPGCIGGPSELIFEAGRPLWLSPLLHPLLGELDYGTMTKKLLPKDMLFGLNMAFPTDALGKIGTYGAAPDRGRNDLVSNSEYPLQVELEQSGYARFYIPEMRVRHHVPHSRTRPMWLLRRAYWQGVSDARLKTNFGVTRPFSFMRMNRGSRTLRHLARALVPTVANIFLVVAWVSMCAGYVVHSGRGSLHG